MIGSRLLVWAAALAAIAIFGRNTLAITINDPGGVTQPFHAAWANLLAAPAARWDSFWYLQIAHAGYYSRASSAFFPLYPLLIALGNAVFGSELVVGALISVVAMTIGLFLLHQLTRLDFGEPEARIVVLLTAFFPTALFLSAVYTEALFLALSVGAIYAARLDRWAIAGLLGCLAGATRPNGVLIALPLVLIYLYGPRAKARRVSAVSWWRPRYRLGRSWLWLVLVPVGAAAYLAYLWVAHDAPLAPFQIQTYFWGREFVGPFGSVVRLVAALPHDVHRLLVGHTVAVEPGDPISWNGHDLIDLGFLAFVLAGLAFSWRRVPVAYFLYALVLLASALSEPAKLEPLGSFPRYLLVIFPIFMGWGAKLAGHRNATRGVLVASAVLLAVMSGLWGIWAWVA